MKREKPKSINQWVLNLWPRDFKFHLINDYETGWLENQSLTSPDKSKFLAVHDVFNQNLKNAKLSQTFEVSAKIVKDWLDLKFNSEKN